MADASRDFARDRGGAAALEYALLAAFLALALYGGANALGPGFARLTGAVSAGLEGPRGAAAGAASSDLDSAPLRP